MPACSLHRRGRPADAARSSITLSTNWRSSRARVGFGAEAPGPPLGFLVVELRLGRPPLVPLGELAEALVPVGAPGHDGGVPREALPRRGGRQATAVEDGRRGQPGEDVLPPIAAGGQAEQLEQRAAGHPGGERHHGGAVGGEAGGVEVLVGEAGVGLGAGVEHGDAVEPGAGPYGVDDGPHRRAHLFVGVGRREHRGALGGDGRRVADARGAAVGDPEAAQRRQHLGVGRRHSGEPGDDGGGHVRRPAPPAGAAPCCESRWGR